MDETYDSIYEKYNSVPFTEKEKRSKIGHLLFEADWIYEQAEKELEFIEEKIDLIINDN